MQDTEATKRVRVRSHFLIRWDAVITVIVAFIVGICVGMALQFAVLQNAASSVPPCTDSIAEAGGICQGPLR